MRARVDSKWQQHGLLLPPAVRQRMPWLRRSHALHMDQHLAGDSPFTGVFFADMLAASCAAGSPGAFVGPRCSGEVRKDW